MVNVRVIPCLLLQDWGIRKSVRFADHVYIGSPINAARVFSRFQADELIVLDIEAGREGRGPDLRVIQEMAEETTMPMTVGGGVRSIEHIFGLMQAGADRVTLNTVAVENPSLVEQAASMFGSQCVVVSIDAKRHDSGKYEVYVDGGRRPTGLDPVTCAVRAQERGAGEILLTAMDRDGTMQGYDTSLIRSVCEAVEIPVIAHGGAGKVEDFGLAVETGGASAVAAGAFFLFFGKRRTVLLTYPTEQDLREVLGPDLVRSRE